MGGHDQEKEDLNKKEQEIINEALTPEEREQLEAIKQNLEKKGTSDHALSFKVARAEACGLISTATCWTAHFPDGSTMTVPDPEPSRDEVLSAVTKAVEQIRDRILNNPVFNPYA